MDLFSELIKTHFKYNFTNTKIVSFVISEKVK